MKKPGAQSRTTAPALSDPLWWGTDRPLQKTFVPIGTVLGVLSNSKKVLAAAEESFGPYGESEESIPADFSIEICSDPVHHQSAPFPPASFRAMGNLFHISCGEGSFAVADLNRRHAIGFVAEEIIDDRSFFRNVFLECLFYVMAVHDRFTPVHAAAVEYQNKGILIWGEAGAGKSTLAYACAQAGFQLISDDVVHLQSDPVTGQLLGWGRPWQVRLLPDTVKFFPELATEVPRLRSDHQWYLEVDLLHRLSEAPQLVCRPSVLLFLNRNTMAPSEVVPLDRQKAFDLLRKDIFLTEKHVLERHYSTLERLVNLDAFRISYSGPPPVAVEFLKTTFFK